MTSPAPSPLRDAIAAVLASTEPTLGMTRGDAAATRDQIMRADLTDDDALTAHDLLHARATFGRAF